MGDMRYGSTVLGSAPVGDTLALALSLASQGYAVFPLQTRGKVPYAGSHGWKDASRDSEVIRRFWKLHPTANVGIATGAPSRIWVLDVDGPAGCEMLRTLIRRHGGLPRTRVVGTGRAGGFHYYWALGSARVGNRVRVADGLDTRGDGGHVVGPGSWHANGTRYVVRVDLPLVEAPPWLLELVGYAEQARAPRPAREPAFRAGDDALDRCQRAALTSAIARLARARGPVGRLGEPTYEPGERNNTLNAEAFGLARTRAPRSIVAPALRSAALEVGLTELAFQRTFESAWSAGMRAVPLARRAGAGRRST